MLPPTSSTTLRHPSCVRVSPLRFHYVCAHKLLEVPSSLHFIPKPPLAFSGSPMPGLSRFLIHFARMPTRADTSPTHRGGSRHHSQAPGHCLYIVCDAMPTPGPDARCADALTPLRLSANHFTHSEFAYGLGQGQAGTLFQAGVCNRVPVAPLHYTTPAVCSNPNVGTPSSLRSFG